MALTNTTILNAKPKDKAYKLSDSGGMYLYVKPNSGKYWRLKYRILGKEKLLALGVYPEVSLKEAREKRDAARKLISTGIDPNKTKQEEKHLAILNAENNFKAVAEEWHNNKTGKWDSKHAQKVWRRLEQNIFAHVGDKPVNEIKPSQILAAIRIVEKRGATDLSHRVLQSCSAIFRYAIATGRADYNPAADLTDALKAHKAKHYPTIKASEIKSFLQKLETTQASQINKLAIKLLLHSFLRQGELRAAEWSHIDFERKEWRIPPENAKMKESHVVPLSSQAIGLLKELYSLTGYNQYLFPTHHRRKYPYISENTINNVIHKMGYKGEMVGHGVRALASTVLNEHGFRPDVIERQLAHAERNKVRAAYNRAEYLEERRQMMQWWGDYIERAEKGGGNVVDGKFHRAG